MRLQAWFYRFLLRQTGVWSSESIDNKGVWWFFRMMGKQKKYPSQAGIFFSIM
jgi:hypothetical protein